MNGEEGGGLHTLASCLRIMPTTPMTEATARPEIVKAESLNGLPLRLSAEKSMAPYDTIATLGDDVQARFLKFWPLNLVGPKHANANATAMAGWRLSYNGSDDVIGDLLKIWGDFENS